jgi:GDP-L-fucose synthase
MNTVKQKKILVCGADGFMGRNIVEYLMRNPFNDIYGTSHVGSIINQDVIHGDHLYSIDLTNKDHVNALVRDIKPDVIVQAAASTSGSKDITERPYIHVTDNAVMNSWLLRSAFDYKVKHFLFLSCGVMYRPGDEPRKETDYNEHDPIFPAYFGVGWTKVYIEKQCEFYSKLGRTMHTVIRHSNTYGPFDKYDFDHSHFFGATVRKIMDAKDGDTITVWGTGEETARDLLYVWDVCNFIELAIDQQADPYELVNVGAGKAYTVKQVVEIMVILSGKDLKIAYDSSKPVIPTKLSLDSTKAKHLFGWEPLVPLEEGIQETFDWYNKYYLKDVHGR